MISRFPYVVSPALALAHGCELMTLKPRQKVLPVQCGASNVGDDLTFRVTKSAPIHTDYRSEFL